MKRLTIRCERCGDTLQARGAGQTWTIYHFPLHDNQYACMVPMVDSREVRVVADPLPVTWTGGIEIEI